jgi:hypothetical protein
MWHLQKEKKRRSKAAQIVCHAFEIARDKEVAS